MKLGLLVYFALLLLASARPFHKYSTVLFLCGVQNEPPSLAALASIVSQVHPLTAFNRPLDRPYVLLRRARGYDIRWAGLSLVSFQSA